MKKNKLYFIGKHICVLKNHLIELGGKIITILYQKIHKNEIIQKKKQSIHRQSSQT